MAATVDSVKINYPQNDLNSPASQAQIAEPLNNDLANPASPRSDNTDKAALKINMEILDNSTRERISSRKIGPTEFNRSLAMFRKTVVKNMLHSAFEAVENSFAEQQRQQEDALRKDLEAAQRAREALRRQLERGQEMEEVQKAAINYETALRDAANDDEEMAKKLLTMFASMHRAKAKYNRSLQVRLDGRYGYETKEDW